MSDFRIIKKNGLFYIQRRNIFFIWCNLKENNNPAFEVGCPPFKSEESAKEWLGIYVRFKTKVIYPVKQIAVS